MPKSDINRKFSNHYPNLAQKLKIKTYCSNVRPKIKKRKSLVPDAIAQKIRNYKQKISGMI